MLRTDQLEITTIERQQARDVQAFRYRYDQSVYKSRDWHRRTAGGSLRSASSLLEAEPPELIRSWLDSRRNPQRLQVPD